MSWLNPGAAWWFLLLPALLLLYILRPRARRLPVPSLRHWQALPQRERTRTQLRLPPLSLLLILQALLLAAGAFALLQPALTAPAGRQTIILLDASASMQARDGSASRFEQARTLARDLVNSLGPDDTATLLRVGPAVTTLCPACRAPDLLAALDVARPGAGRADFAAALAVAAGLAGQQAPGRVETVVISDGAFPPLTTPALPPALRFIAVGSPVANQAITALSARQPPDGRPGYEAFARVENHSADDATLSVSAFADTVPLPARNVTLPAGGHADLIWPLPAGTARFTVRLPGGDALPLDDEAVLTLPDAGQYRVLVDAVQPDFYIHALAGIPGLVVTGTQDSRLGGADVTIVEGALPDPLPAGPLLLVNPSGALLPTQGDDLTNLRPLPAANAQPLLAGLDLQPLLVRKAHALAPVAWLEPVLPVRGGALLLAGQHDGRRIAVLTFDPRDSNLPTLASFPLLMDNLITWLDPLADAESFQPGDTLALTPGTTVVPPDGTPAPVGAGGVFAAIEAPGLYQVTSAGHPAHTFAANMADAQESDLAPQLHPELDRAAPPAPDVRVTRQEYWPPLAVLALLLLGLDWAVFAWKRGAA